MLEMKSEFVLEANLSDLGLNNWEMEMRIEVNLYINALVLTGDFLFLFYSFSA